MLTALGAFCILYLVSVVSRYGIADGKYAYATYKEQKTRATPYQPYVVSKTCLLKPDSGPCRSYIPMYFYEPSLRNCSSFSWGGCQGNGNRFDTHTECIQYCLSHPNQPKTRPKWCSLNFDYGFCFGSINRWYYDPLWKVCKPRIYSGCGGNKNNFYNKEQCDSICVFGVGVIKTAIKEKSELKRVLIVNAPDATTRKGKDQGTPESINNIINNIT